MTEKNFHKVPLEFSSLEEKVQHIWDRLYRQIQAYNKFVEFQKEENKKFDIRLNNLEEQK